ncbi:hypothetical protein FB45DRAFT_1116123, partial [Roridomyces roridus]
SFWVPRKNVWFLLKGNFKPCDLFQPSFFIWDPFAILGKSYHMLCPNCGKRNLTRDGVVERPRRVVDIDECFWIIGYSYACQGGCGDRFRSWDQRIIERLPKALAAEFPAHLTWRSGLSNRAFGVVRSCFQHGVGAEEVADIFRMQHLRRFDEMRLQYLRIKVQDMDFGQSYEPFKAFDDRSLSGFHGFTPSGQWLRDMYDNFIELHRDTLNQHTAMLSARVCAIDHSHKLAKHVFKVDGVPIFTALLTVTNEKGEIRVCVFVATKSHSQYKDALQRLADDLHIYGHNQPEVFYTDNMIDKPMLESMFSSLRAGVNPVDKHGDLPEFIGPDFVRNPEILDSRTAIDNAVRGILTEIPDGGHIVVGFDSEWNVEVAAHGHILSRGPPAIVQIAYQDSVYILKIGEMLSRKNLPTELTNFLRDDRVRKVGRQVNGDLRQLAVAAGQPPEFYRGALDLGTFAKSRFLTRNATASLADLFASTFGKRLPKPVAERVS